MTKEDKELFKGFTVALNDNTTSISIHSEMIKEKLNNIMAVVVVLGVIILLTSIF